MTAKEMFENLCFELTNESPYIVTYMKKLSYIIEYVRFDLINSRYEVICSCVDNYIDVKLHKAITQQMKELGWIK